MGDDAEGPWKIIAEGQLPQGVDDENPVPKKEITLDNPSTGRYLQFRCETSHLWSGTSYCELQYLGVFQEC